MKKQIAILGSTGSIGTQALQVIEEHPDLYEAYALTANNRVELLIAQARKFQPEVVVIAIMDIFANFFGILKRFTLQRAAVSGPNTRNWMMSPTSKIPRNLNIGLITSKPVFPHWSGWQGY